ncbi:hypothetical protein [Salinarimonas soli]|uniref:DUF3035 domain-containing protein n=1 Tax=Salinarimonas soli TaxID=1638099 RepID=A0A5B2V7W1_9HYPH|nr:hypothetical protein [Salinarimonas soli]KAA2235114.1 hypothetical protein F0L46_21335 [Salinarimonas soli]
MKRIVVLAGLGLMASVVGASAQEGVFMKDVLSSMGLVPGERPQIDYRERAPLVVPPSPTLRTPVAPNAAEANGGWPADQDLVRERRRQREAAIPETERERRRMNDQNPRISIDEVRSGRVQGAATRDPMPHRPDSGREASGWLHPDVLRSQGTVPEQTYVSGAEPERRSLTEPPSGLRRPDPRAPIRATRDLPGSLEDEASPGAYNRQQAERARR